MDIITVNGMGSEREREREKEREGDISIFLSYNLTILQIFYNFNLLILQIYYSPSFHHFTSSVFLFFCFFVFSVLGGMCSVLERIISTM